MKMNGYYETARGLNHFQLQENLQTLFKGTLEIFGK